jgi:hypothetical protein
MDKVTFLVLEGVDKGRVFRDLSLPVTIGREEGNSLQLNDERVSRFHAKVQLQDGDVIITDLDSTNGTRVNGMSVQIRRLRPGDQICIGRTMLLFGTMEQIAARRAALLTANTSTNETRPRVDDLFPILSRGASSDPTVGHGHLGMWSPLEDDVPPLPRKLTPAQIARLVEIFDYLHRGLTSAVENIDANDDGTEVRIGFAEWQTIQAVQLLLARYSRLLTEPQEEPSA